ncbi:hypothetical protein CSW59_01135 [Caulobacter sp. BP25]|nr:hypothetical protein CSW59_01135 [Caulobacter sp. BP25]
MEAKGCVLAWSGSSSSTAGPLGNEGAQVPVRPEQGHLTGRWRITIARSVGLRRNGTHTSILRTDVRRSASLSIPSASDRVKRRRCASVTEQASASRTILALLLKWLSRARYETRSTARED